MAFFPTEAKEARKQGNDLLKELKFYNQYS